MDWIQPYYKYYVGAWTCGLFIVLVLYLRSPQEYALARPAYLRFLLVPWKIFTFLAVAAGFLWTVRQLHDPSWDYPAVGVMCVLTFWSAPWAVGALCRVARGLLSPRQGFVAFCLWMFTAGWFHESYYLLRFGTQTSTWPWNLLVASGLYLLCGLMWNLDWTPEEGTVFAFAQEGWPAPPAAGMERKILWAAALFMALIGLLIMALLPNSPIQGIWSGP